MVGRVEQIGPALRRSASRSIAGRDEIELYLSSDSAVLFGAAAAMMSPKFEPCVKASLPILVPLTTRARAAGGGASSWTSRNSVRNKGSH